MRVLLCLVVLSVFLFQCKNEPKKSDPNTYFCDAETLSNNGENFISYGDEFNGGAGQTNEEAYEGKYSCVVNKKNPYGMTFRIDSLIPGESYKISVYRKSEGDLGSIAIQSPNNYLYLAENKSYGSKLKDGWEQLVLNVQLPYNLDSIKFLKIYVFNNGSEKKAFFDNLKIERRGIKNKPTENYAGIDLVIADQDYDQILNNRDVAIHQRMISNNLKKEVDAFLKYQGKTIPVGIRLKGDWTDHLMSPKWSFRIKVKGGDSFLGLKTFSIQAPEIRDFLYEWLVHEACKQEDLLTTRMEYIPVSVNGKYLGVYNLEEHFEKQLVEAKQRREGVIVCFSEAGFWETVLYEKKNNQPNQAPFFVSSTITPFKQKKTLKTEKLKKQFLIAQNLMQRYKEGDKKLEEIFDVNRLAKMYALMEIFNVGHGLAWHNQRFYYNPIISKLEPIVYDCYSGVSSHRDEKETMLKQPAKMPDESYSLKGFLIKNLFNNQKFIEKYIYYLNKYSNKTYIDHLLATTNVQIDSLNDILNPDYPGYYFNTAYINDAANMIKKQLAGFEKRVLNEAPQYVLNEKYSTQCASAVPFKNISLVAHKEEINGSQVKLSLRNYHCMPISVIGYNTKETTDTIYKITPIKLEKFPDNNQIKNELTLKENPKKLFYKVVGAEDDSVYSVKVIPWPHPTKNLPYESMMNEPLDPHSMVYELGERAITFKKGQHQVKNNIIIPQGYKVVFEPGVELILNNGKFLMSYSPVQMEGTKEAPIKISSTDGTGNGFSVIQAEGKSKLDHVIFDGLNTFNKYGWTLTGAVTFFESEVEIRNSVFTNNHCEDGLNIVHTKFLIENSSVSKTFSDGFDADFCEGEVIGSTFSNTGNDCLDFSTSKIEVKDVDIVHSGDKGISCGEDSRITIINVSIDTAVIGVASKDKSETIINNISISNSNIGFSAFQKKPEYGPATIEVKSYSVNNVKELTQTDLDSKVLFEKNKSGNQAL